MTYNYKYNKTLNQFSKSNRKTSTDAEKHLWFHLRNRQLGGYKFRRQFPINNYILDFYCHEKKLAIELDGSQHMEKIMYDTKRQAALNKLGIQIIRFWDNDVLQNTTIVLEEILRNLTPTLS